MSPFCFSNSNHANASNPSAIQDNYIGIHPWDIELSQVSGLLAYVPDHALNATSSALTIVKEFVGSSSCLVGASKLVP